MIGRCWVGNCDILSISYETRLITSFRCPGGRLTPSTRDLDVVTGSAVFWEGMNAKNSPNSASFSSCVLVCHVAGGTQKGSANVYLPWLQRQRKFSHLYTYALVRTVNEFWQTVCQSVESFSRWLMDSAALFFHGRLTHEYCWLGLKTACGGRIRRVVEACFSFCCFSWTTHLCHLLINSQVENQRTHNISYYLSTTVTVVVVVVSLLC